MYEIKPKHLEISGLFEESEIDANEPLVRIYIYVVSVLNKQPVFLYLHVIE